MRFAQPAALWLGASAALVLLAYLVRRRARRVEVPFLGLWTGALSERRGGFGRALTRRLDLLLAVLACAAVAIAAGAPFVPGRASTVRDLVLVLDGGVELRAADRAERLRRLAEAEILRRARGTHFLCVRVDPDGPQVYSGRSRRAASAFVRTHDPGWRRASPAEAFALARAGAGGLTRPDLVFCTYRPGRPDGFRLRTVRVPASNAGFAALEVVGDPEGGGRLARVRVRAQGRIEIPGRWTGAVDGEQVLELPLEPSGDVVLEVRQDGDRFAPDDTLFLRLPERERPRVLVVAAGDPSPFLVSAMRALEETRAVKGPLEKTTPDRVAGAVSRYDVVVFDRCAPPEPVPGLRALYLAPSGGALPFRLGPPVDAPSLFDVQAEHPVLRGTGIGPLPPVRARALHGGEPLAHAAPGPVIAAGPGWVAISYDPERGVLASSPAYPLFLRNAIAHLAGGGSARAVEFVRIGERREDGTRWDGPPGFRDDTPPVDFLEPSLDLAAADAASDPLAPVGAPAVPDRPLGATFAAVALFLLLLGWWWFWR